MALHLEVQQQEPIRQPRRLRSIELFTGAGGLAVGTHLAGFCHEALIEWDRDACGTLRENVLREAVPRIRDWRVEHADIRQVDLSPFEGVDLVAGGAPCQPFSIGGKHRGSDDERNMIPQFARVVRELRPRAFMLENVRGLLRPGFRPYFEYVLLELAYPDEPRREGEEWTDHRDRLTKLGRRREPAYVVTHKVLNAADYGVPQMRHRVFVVGFRADLGLRFQFPEATHSQDALMIDQWVTGAYWERHQILQPKESPTNRTANVNLFACHTRPYRTVRDGIVDLPEPIEAEVPEIPNHRLQPGARSYIGHTGSPLDQPAKTLKAGDHGVPGGENMLRRPDGSVRYFTVREAARLQTFPDLWRFRGAWTEAMRQIGNAVPVHLAKIVADSVAAQLY